ncbi:MAG: glycoside hydrolase family 13 protein [Caldilineaceae bacterium]|nr:glycoside hydrolase family 13 protein [Caldilineaceae bacterium]
MSFVIPEWVKDAVFYQIFPDRFARSPRTVHRRGLQFRPWGSPPEEQGYQGGDLHGIVDRLDYLCELGITALYLNPVFASASNHGYHTYDYLKVDPLLGGDAALRELLDEAHRRDMRVVIDGVFNHTGRGFWAFHHILENGGDSPYIDWFLVRDWPLRPYDNPDNLPINYDAWWGMAALPKLNIRNPGVRDYLFEVAKYWIDFGADGWRLDVPEEIDDAEFWQAFRRVVKQANPDAYIVGEIWQPAQEWLQGDRFDAVMNYLFSRAALGFFGADTIRLDYKPGGYPVVPLNASTFAKTVEEMLALYPWPVTQAQLNLINSHDTARTLWMANEDETALRLCLLFQMSMPGAPCIYYGDEIGLTGGHDPGSRGAFLWDDRSCWNHELHDVYRRAIHLRHRYPALRRGDFRTLHAGQPVYAFRRDWRGESAIVAFNVGHTPATLDLPVNEGLEGRVFTDVWNGGQHTAQRGALNGLRIPARAGAVLVG